MDKTSELYLAIQLVLVARYKKDAPKAFEYLENNGYHTYKRDTHQFVIRNRATGRELYLTTGYRRRMYYGNYKSMLWENTGNFDFIGYFEKPFNTEWYELQNKGGYWGGTPTQKKFRTLKDAKGMVQWKQAEIDKCKQDINNLMAQLENLTASKCNYQRRLNDTRVELGLRKKY